MDKKSSRYHPSLRDFNRTLTGDDFEAMRRRLESSNDFKDEEGFILRF